MAWEFHNYNSGAAGIRTYYDVPNQKIEFHPPLISPLRQGSYRGLAATANHFAREVHMDEIAHSLQMDPLEFRLKNLKEERLRSVFEQGAAKIWMGKAQSPPIMALVWAVVLKSLVTSRLLWKFLLIRIPEKSRFSAC